MKNFLKYLTIFLATLWFGAIGVSIAGATFPFYQTQLGTGTSTTGYVLTSTGTGANTVASWQASGGGSPGSPSTSVQFNNGGIFGGDSNLEWDNTNKQLAIGSATGFAGSSQIPLSVGTNINNFSGVYAQNISTGSAASTDFIVGADNDGTAQTGHFGDFGVQSSGYMPTSTGVIKNVSIANGGTGYANGNVLTITGGGGNATLTVTSNSGGIITGVSITLNGTGYSISNNNAVTGGAGTGALINITALTDTTAILANDVYLYGSGGNLDIGTDGGVAGKVINFFTGGTATGNIRMTIDDNKTTITNINNTTLRGIVAQQVSSDTGSSRINLLKARGTTTTPTTIVTGDLLGNLLGWGYDGTNYINSTSIIAGSSGTIGTNRVPSYLSFSTSTDASPSVLTERMRILSNGNVGIGTTSPNVTVTVLLLRDIEWRR